MTAIEIINTIKAFEGVSFAEIAENIGVHPSAFYEIQSGKIKAISAQLAIKIFNKYPDYSLEFLLTGENYKRQASLPPHDDVYYMHQDNSMEPYIMSGDCLAIKTWTEGFFLDGQVYLFETKNGNKIVRYASLKDGVYTLYSCNAEYSAVTLLPSEIERISNVVAIVRT